MSATIWIRDPRYVETGKAKRSYATLDSLQGKTMAIMNNSWTSMDEIAAILGNEFKKRFGVAKVITYPVPTASACEESIMRDAAKADFAIVGLAN
jgi:hypothetical protein